MTATGDTNTQTIPESGQLCRVRSRLWAVNGILPSSLDTKSSKTSHLIDLVSVEDDSMGEELRVLWELEPGAETIESVDLPKWDKPDKQQVFGAFINAVRWGAASLADQKTLLSPYRSGIQIEDYQLDPVVRAIQMPRANLLIADDVGLGKTIEAGLVIQEFVSRHRARTVLIVVPAPLQIKWRDEMREKFGLEFKIVDREMFQDLRRRRGIHVNPWTHYPRLITSIDFLKRQRPMQLFREVLPPDGLPRYPRTFDILVVDEAHNCAPSGTGRYAIDSDRTNLIRTISPHFEHRLFLTATPHNGYQESFSALLELIDNQRFAVGVTPDRKQLESIMVRRLKSELAEKPDGTRRFPRRSPIALEVEYSKDEKDAHQLLSDYAKKLRTGLSAESQKIASDFVTKLLKKRLFSSPIAFLNTLVKHGESLRKTIKKDLASLKYAPDDEYDNDEEYEEDLISAVESASHDIKQNYEALKDDITRLKSWAEQYRGKPDGKGRALIDWLKSNIKPKGEWSDRRVIIFTEYRDTQKWIELLLYTNGLFDEGRVSTIYGGLEEEHREKIKAAFQAEPDQAPVRILLATDAASEGIDLQNHCADLIHFEIPWNPNRMEQRNGRIDRHGQRSEEVRLHHFVSKGFQQSKPSAGQRPGTLEGDLEFLYRAALKLNEMSRDLFGKVSPVIAEQVELAMLGRLTALDTVKVEKEGEALTRQLKFERNLREQIQKLHDRLFESKEELNVSPENVKFVVDIALQLAGQPPLKDARLEGVWPKKGSTGECPVFWMPELHGSWARCIEGLRHPHTGIVRPITFDHALCDGRDDLVLVHLNHPLVQMSARFLRAEIWSAKDSKALSRICARVAAATDCESPTAIVYARLIILGGDGHRLHEELISAGGNFDGKGGFRRIDGVAKIKSLMTAPGSDLTDQKVLTEIASLYPKIADKMNSAVASRAQERHTSLQKTLTERADSEGADIERVLLELKKGIEKELEDHRPLQLSLFEETQFDKNRANLEFRLRQIPEEIAKERKAINDRFAGISSRIFPIAVSFLIPEGTKEITI